MNLAVFLIMVVVYLVTGWQAARLSVPRAWVTARKRRAEGGPPVRNSVKTQTTAMIIGWPIYLTVLLVSQRFNTMIDQGDPEAAARATAERQRWVAETEHELGIGNGTPRLIKDCTQTSGFRVIYASENEGEQS